MTYGQNTETNQRLIAFGVSAVIGIIAIVLMSIIFKDTEQAGAFLLDRHSKSFPYPFTIQNIMWIMFFIGCGEIWGRFNQSDLELAQLSKRYLPEDETTMLRAQDLGSYYNRMRPSRWGAHILFTTLIHALHFAISGEQIGQPDQFPIKFLPGVISART